MNCIHCGKELHGDEKFCPVCGKPVEASPFAEFEPAAPAAEEGAAAEPASGPAAPVKTIYCRHCGAAISEKAYVCTHCGALVAEPQNASDQKPINGFGLAGMVLGILSFLFGVLFCITPVVGLVLSIIGMAKRKACRLNGFAIAGLVLSIVTILIWGPYWLVGLLSF